ncbi:MAG TPA: nitronate monooxygenase [Bacteroidetes bacterium]|nr:nitronate monooxygenase [Bacteroidota bacterium]
MTFSNNRVCSLFNIQYPIVQGGMVWCSGWKLASSVSNNGGLGLIGAGSMHPDVLRDHIRKCKTATANPFGVNVPLLYPDIEMIMQIIIEEGVEIVFTSAGNPANWTSHLKSHNIKVAHVVPNVKLARKCVEKGVDLVVCEGFEAGGHNGKDELTTMVLVPQVVDAISEYVPVVAAGGIGDGRGMVAVMALGADGVQIGSRFAVTEESSAHENFKKAVLDADDTRTVLTLKQITSVRLMKNAFYESIREAELNGADEQTLRQLLGKGRAKRGIFEGDLENGELEIGQISGLIRDIPTVKQVIDRILVEYSTTVKTLS